MLHMVLSCFNFKSGPLKGLWSRFGYDASVDPTSRHFHSLNIRISEKTWKDLSRRYEYNVARALIKFFISHYHFFLYIYIC